MTSKKDFGATYDDCFDVIADGEYNGTIKVAHGSSINTCIARVKRVIPKIKVNGRYTDTKLLTYGKDYQLQFVGTFPKHVRYIN